MEFMGPFVHTLFNYGSTQLCFAPTVGQIQLLHVLLTGCLTSVCAPRGVSS